MRTLPVPLAWIVEHSISGSLDAMRRAYATARGELGDAVTPDQLATVQSALEAEGARLLQAQREIALVREALVRQPR